MSRSLILERIRINIEIFCESIGDYLASSFGGLKKPIIGLVWLALVMTIRSARKGVLKMKRGGLTAGRYETSYKSFAASSAAGGSNSYWNQNAAGTTGTYGGSYGSHNAAAGAYGTQNSAAGTYGAQNSATGAYASNLPGRAYGSTSANNLPGTSGTTYGQTAYNNPSQNTYGATSTYGSSAGATGSLPSDQAQRSLSDLIDKHGQSIRVMDSRLFKDYGGIHDFYGQVETLQAYEGAGVVEKVLQSPGYNKVLVVDGGGNVNAAIFTKLAAASAKQNGWKGVIIHGAIRDSKHIASTAIGCKAMGTNPNRGRGTTGSKGLSLNIAGLPVTTGMWIYCDKDGIALSDMELTLGPTPGMASNAYNSVGGNTVGGYNTVGGATTGGYNAGAATGGYMSQTSNGYQQTTPGYNGAGSTGAVQNGGQVANSYGSQQTGGNALPYQSQNAYANRYGTGNTANLPLSATSSTNAWSSGSNRGYPYSHANSMANSNAYLHIDIIALFLFSFLPLFVIHIELV